MKARIFSLTSLSVVLLLLPACTGGGNQPVREFTSVLEGEISYNGTLPPLQYVTYQDRDGDYIELLGYPGLVVLVTEEAMSVPLVQTEAALEDGELVAAIPKAGLFTISVPEGQECHFMTMMYGKEWVRGAMPWFPTEEAEMAAFDNFTSIPGAAMCADPHGSHVKSVMERTGAVVQTIDLYRDFVNGRVVMASPYELWGELSRQMEAAYRDGRRGVFNFSLQSLASADGDRLNIRTVCSVAPLNNGCLAIQRAQGDLWTGALQALEAADPAVLGNTIVVFSAGNAGVDLTQQLDFLSARYPRAFDHFLVVGGSDASGAILEDMNYADRHVVYALGRDVPTTGIITCSGTSFSAPEVARVLDDVWAEFPDRDPAEVIEALRQALMEWGLVSLPIDPSTGWTDEAFVERVIGILEGEIEPPPTGGCTSMFDGEWSGTFYGGGGSFDLSLTLVCAGTGTTGAIHYVESAGSTFPPHECSVCVPQDGLSLAGFHYPEHVPHPGDGLSLFFPNGSSLASGNFASPFAPGGDPGDILISPDGGTITGQFWIVVCPAGIFQGYSWVLHRAQ